MQDFEIGLIAKTAQKSKNNKHFRKSKKVIALYQKLERQQMYQQEKKWVKKVIKLVRKANTQWSP